MFSFEGGSLLLELVFPAWRLKDKYIVIFDEKTGILPAVKFINFGSSKPLDPDPH
jgi:hypothetical protein